MCSENKSGSHQSVDSMTITLITARTRQRCSTTMHHICNGFVLSVIQCLFIWSLLLGRQSSAPTFVVQGQIISIIPGVEPSAFPSASPTVYSIKVPPVPTMEPTIAPSIGPTPSITFVPVPTVQVTLPPWMVPTSQTPTSLPTIEATNVPTSVPVLSIVNTTTNMPIGSYAPTGVGPSSNAPVLASPTANGNTTNLDRDGSDSKNNLIVKIIVPIMIVAALLLCFGLYASHRPRKNRKNTLPLRNDVVPNRDLDFDPNRPDGGNSLYDDASIYTSPITAVFTKKQNNSGKFAAKTDMSTSSVGGVVNQDFSDKTEASNEDIYDNDETDDYIVDLTAENRTMASSSAISAVTPNSFENHQIGYMEEGKMIQERYEQINKELYSSEKISPRSDTSDIVLRARSLLLSPTIRETSTVHSRGLISPISDEGVEITFLNEKSDHTAQYDDIVGIDNSSTIPTISSYCAV